MQICMARTYRYNIDNARIARKKRDLKQAGRAKKMRYNLRELLQHFLRLFHGYFEHLDLNGGKEGLRPKHYPNTYRDQNQYFA